MRILSLEELEELGAKAGKVIDVPPKREDIACVMYTSVSRDGQVSGRGRRSGQLTFPYDHLGLDRRT